jgi:MFS family permease
MTEASPPLSFESTPEGGAAATRAVMRRMLLPLALTQFIASFAGTNMNVAINTITEDLDTSVHAVQTTITLFLLCMAALMIPGSKLTDVFGRKPCFVAGLSLYGCGALVGAFAPNITVLTIGYSLFEGVGSALMIPPIYILATLYFETTESRARAFGAISGMGGIGAAAGPLIGGLITTAVSWRASFVLQAAVVAGIIYLTRSLVDPLPPDRTRNFDVLGAVLSAAAMFFLVIGILQVGVNTGLVVLFLALAVVLGAWFFLHVRALEHGGKEPLLSTSLFRNRTSNLGLVTQNVQWLMMMGISFSVSVFLQIVRGHNAIETGVIFTATTVGILASSLGAARFARRRAQRTLILAGFVTTIVGILVLIALVKAGPPIFAFAPGLLLIGLGVGVMLTPSVNVVQSAFPEEKQGEISGLSRSVSNLGSSLGTALAGTILVQQADQGNRAYAYALLFLAAVGLIGLGAAWLLPRDRPAAAAAES